MSDEKVREWSTITIRLPEEDKQRLVKTWKQFDYLYHDEHGVECEKNRTFHPAIARAAFSERTVGDILDDLLAEGVDELDFPGGDES